MKKMKKKKQGRRRIKQNSATNKNDNNEIRGPFYQEPNQVHRE